MSNSEKLPPSLEGKLPAPVENAGDIAKLTTGIAAVFASVWFPITTGIALTVITLASERFLRRPQMLLLEELRKGNVQNLSNAQLTAFVPMGYKFFEAAKEGEYEHNLSILAAYLTGELKQDVPEPASFSRMVRRVEGLSKTDLKVIALIDAFLSQATLDAGTRCSVMIHAASPLDDASPPDVLGVLMVDLIARGNRPYVTASALAASSRNESHLTRTDIEEALVDLAARGFLVADSATRSGKSEEYYYASSNLRDLMDRARERVEQAGSKDASS
jgi:hypothetical protein